MHMNFMGWPLSHGVPKEKMNEELTSVLLELYIRETKCSHSQKDFWLEEEQPQPSSVSTRPAGRRGGYASAWGQASATPETGLPPSRTLPWTSHLSFMAGKLEGEKLPSKGGLLWLSVQERLYREYSCSALESIVAECVMVGHIERVTVGHIGHVVKQ